MEAAWLFAGVHSRSGAAQRMAPPLRPPPQVYFGLPTPAQRLAILRVHTKRWALPPPDELLQQVRMYGR